MVSWDYFGNAPHVSTGHQNPTADKYKLDMNGLMFMLPVSPSTTPLLVSLTKPAQHIADRNRVENNQCLWIYVLKYAFVFVTVSSFTNQISLFE